MPTLLELLSNDEGIQQLKANAKQLATGAARGVTTDLAGGPVDLANMVLGALAGKGFGGLSETPVGGSKQIRKFVGQPTEDTAMETVGNLLTAVLPSPNSIAGTAALLGIIGSPNRILGAEKAFEAQKALQRGKDYPGVYRGAVDNRMRAVLSDADAQLNTKAMQPNAFDKELLGLPLEGVKLPNLLSHPKLFEAYPELADVTVGPLLSLGASGAYSPVDKRIAMGSTKNLNEYVSTLLHETQHAVQDIDKFTPGGNTSVFLPNAESFKQAARLANDKVSEYEKLLKQRYPDFSPWRQAPVDVVADPDYGMYTKFKAAQKQFGEIETENYDKYRHIAGEAEARAVQAMYENDMLKRFMGPPKSPSAFDLRAGKTIPQSKDSTDPRDYYDVKWEDLIMSPYDKASQP